MSDLHGLGGLSNAENQKAADPTARLYSARAFFRQTIRLAETRRRSRQARISSAGSVFTSFGRDRRQMAVIDIFDSSALAHDGRTQFFNWALMAGGASDYAADARGYTVGFAVEYYRDDWVFRFGHFAQPKESNGLALDYRLWAHFGENLEVEHRHAFGAQGERARDAFSQLREDGGFSDAVAEAAANGGTPDVAKVRRDRAKLGFGIGLEQNLTRDLGLFGRYSWNDGRTETTPLPKSTIVDRGLAMGGRLWFRPRDTVAVAFVQDSLSDSHRTYWRRVAWETSWATAG